MKKTTTILCFALLFTFVSTTDAQKRSSSDSDSQTVKKKQKQFVNPKKKSKKKGTKKRRATKKEKKTGARSVSKSDRIFNMEEGVSSSSLIGAWEITDACVYESGFEGDGLCATDDDIQEFVNNINVLVKDDRTGFLDMEDEREELTWVEDENGLQVDIGDDDFGQFSLDSDGVLTISDDFGSGCYSENDEEIEDIDNASACEDEGGEWDEAASMIYMFSRIAEGAYDGETGKRVLSSSRKKKKRGFARRVRRGASSAAKKAKKAAVARARRAAEAARKAAARKAVQIAAKAKKAAEEEAKRVAAAAAAAKQLAAELEKQALELAKKIAQEAIGKYDKQIKMAPELIANLTNSPAYKSMASVLSNKGTPTLEQLSDILNEVDLLGQMLKELNQLGMKSFFIGVSGSVSSGHGAEMSVCFAISIKDILTVWDDLKNFKEPSLVPNMAIQTTASRIVGTQYGVDADVVFGWNTDEPQKTYGSFWDFAFGVEAFGASVSSSAAIVAPSIGANGVSGGRYLGQSFSGGKGEVASLDFTFGSGLCCIFHINNNMQHICN